MKTKFTKALALMFFMISALCQAEIIQMGFTGLVDLVGDSYNLLENEVQTGDSISGFYVYDSETLGSAGAYLYTTSPYGISATIGDLTFQTNSTNVDFRININNGTPNVGADIYLVNGYNNLELYNGLIVDSINVRLDDNSGTALSSDALPLVPLNLTQWQYNHFSIYGSGYPSPPIGGDKTVPFEIGGYLTSMYLVPEPMTLLLFGLVGLFIRKRN